MLAAIKGKVTSCEEGKLTLEVGAFFVELHVPRSFAPKTGNEIKLFTSLFIREENLALYGFGSELEKKFFQLALTVPGVGPKLGLSLLSGMPIRQLAKELQSGNAKALEKISGVGKKLAQRLIGDLKGKVGQFIADESRTGSSGETKSQAVDVLTDLGLESDEAWSLVESLPGNEHTVNDLVDLSLKKLGERKK